MDYYDVLGVDSKAHDKDIKSAFREKAKRYHPDAGGDPEKFRQINEAYETLKDPSKRQQYDYSRNGAGRIHIRTNGGEFSDIFETVFRDLNGFVNPGFTQQRRNRTTKNKDLSVTVSITLRDTLSQQNRIISVRHLDGERVSTKITIPAGIRTKSTIRYNGLGDDSIKDIKPGDLFVQINVEPDPNYCIEDNKLFTNITVDAFQAIIGCRVELTTLEDKKILLNIPAGTQYGTVLAINGHGLPNKRMDRDKLFVRVLVKIPENLSQERLNTIRRFTESQ